MREELDKTVPRGTRGDLDTPAGGPQPRFGSSGGGSDSVDRNTDIQPESRRVFLRYRDRCLLVLVLNSSHIMDSENINM